METDKKYDFSIIYIKYNSFNIILLITLNFHLILHYLFYEKYLYSINGHDLIYSNI